MAVKNNTNNISIKKEFSSPLAFTLTGNISTKRTE